MATAPAGVVKVETKKERKEKEQVPVPLPSDQQLDTAAAECVKAAKTFTAWIKAGFTPAAKLEGKAAENSRLKELLALLHDAKKSNRINVFLNVNPGEYSALLTKESREALDKAAGGITLMTYIIRVKGGLRTWQAIQRASVERASVPGKKEQAVKAGRLDVLETTVASLVSVLGSRKAVKAALLKSGKITAEELAQIAD